ncbi:hypothetical protein WICMUC_002479 [Wickerhamomyces mucosus]|uniref:Protein YAE1 n=1 Tax=Wickerhamomyces mucosus TaxID=1378264 RepID=A0A9P8PPD0_9ASCO|nr:hypothetical protein WICMUC_002479 [Wickerhamomyces mucosus]
MTASDDHLSSDDIWESSDEEFVSRVPDEEFYGKKPESKENNDISSLRRIHAKQGYLAGLSSKKEETLQEGFDAGYPEGGELGIAIGEIVGSLHYFVSLPLDDDKLEEGRKLLERVKKELHIKKVLNDLYFDEDLRLKEGKHPLITKWEKLVNELLDS